MVWDLTFISEEDFRRHVRETITQYGKSLQPYDLADFNSNVIDPVKLIFDKNIYGLDWKTVISNELARQRDKSNNNAIGYFHQKIFRYIENCRVPEQGWDVIVEREGGFDVPDAGHVARIYVEMKNKHNTMNSASANETYAKMQNQTLSDDDCVCFLVEAISKTSQNVKWRVSHKQHKNIRKVSMDKFYETVTGDPNGFYKVCQALPVVLHDMLSGAGETCQVRDRVFGQLSQAASSFGGSFEMALYLLGFRSYAGFMDQ